MGTVKLNEKLIGQLDIVMGRSWAKLEKEIDIKRSTLYRMKCNPVSIDMRQLLAIANGLRIPIRNFFYTGEAYTVGQKEDYVTEPYLPCRYEYETLRSIIVNRRDITWVKGYEYTGVTEDNLKNSLLQDESPVVRLLDFCNGFDIDPFQVIIDPNPPKDRTRRKKVDNAMIAGMAAMSKEIEQLNSITSDLVAKYQDVSAKYDDMLQKYTVLLHAHKMLLQRFDEHIDGSYGSMAADAIG